MNCPTRVRTEAALWAAALVIGFSIPTLVAGAPGSLVNPKQPASKTAPKSTDPVTSGKAGEPQPGKAAGPTDPPGEGKTADPEGKAEGKTEEPPKEGAGPGFQPRTSQCSVPYQPGGRLVLQGQWEMHVDRTGASTYDAVKNRTWRRVKLPFRFKDHPESKDHVGHVWLRCGIQLDGQAAPALGLLAGLIMDLDEVFFNGTRIGGTGSFNPLRVDIEKRRLYSLPRRLWRTGENLLVFHIYGTHSAAGLTEVPQVVHEPETARRLFNRETPAIALSGIYLLVALFFGLFAAFFWHRKENLYFALFSLSLGLYYLIRTRMRYELFSDFHFSYKVELLLLIMAPVFFLNYLLKLIRQKPSMIALVWQGYYGLLLLTTLLSGKPTEWDMVVRANLVGLAGFIVLMIGIFRKNYAEHRHQLRYLLLGLIPVMPAMINDMLIAARIYEGPRLVIFAFLIFLTFVAMQLADSVLDLYRSLREQENELRQLEKRKTSSIFNISSEFRSILEGIEASLSTFSAGKAVSARKAKTEQQSIAREIQRLDSFLSDSNLLPLLESGDYVARRVRFSVRKMAEAVLDLVTSSTGRPRKRLVVDLPDDDVEMTGDPDLISAGLRHLVENALLYTEGQVDVSIERQGHLLEIVVRDEGPGLTEEQCALVFQKFVRGVEDSSDIAGTGIGLHIVQLVAARLGGEFRLENGGGFFSTFTLRIPLITEQRAA